MFPTRKLGDLENITVKSLNLKFCILYKYLLINISLITIKEPYYHQMQHCIIKYTKYIFRSCLLLPK